MKQTHRQSLYVQFKSMTDEQLTNIITDNDYDETAKDVAKEILNSDRSEYYQRQKEKQLQEEQQNKIEKEKYKSQQINPLYDDVHQMAKDIHFIKTCFVISVISTIALSVLGLITILKLLL